MRRPSSDSSDTITEMASARDRSRDLWIGDWLPRWAIAGLAAMTALFIPIVRAVDQPSTEIELLIMASGSSPPASVADLDQLLRPGVLELTGTGETDDGVVIERLYNLSMESAELGAPPAPQVIVDHGRGEIRVIVETDQDVTIRVGDASAHLEPGIATATLPIPDRRRIVADALTAAALAAVSLLILYAASRPVRRSRDREEALGNMIEVMGSAGFRSD